MAFRRIVRPAEASIAVGQQSQQTQPTQQLPPLPAWAEQAQRKMAELVADIPAVALSVAPAGPLPQLATIREACRLAGIARRTMYYWIARGQVRTRRVASGRLRVEVESLFRPQEPAA